MSKPLLLLAALGLAVTTATHAQNTFPTSGNVGIGTTSPITSLHVRGSATFGTGVEWTPASVGNLQITGAPASPISSRLIYGTDNTGWQFRIAKNDGSVITDQFTIQDNGNVGIGTTTPSSRLHVEADVEGVVAYFRNSRGWGGSQFAIRTAGYSDFNGIRVNGEDTSRGIYSERQLGVGTNGQCITFETQVSQEMMRLTPSGNVGIGTTSPTEKLAVNGKIRAKEVIVETTGWSDHVFADSYQLQSLSEVEQHIKTEKHLPGVPSVQEVAEKGVSVGDMQAILLAKIEELTLHQIAQEKEQIAQRAKLEAQAAELAALKTENAQLKAQTK